MVRQNRILEDFQLEELCEDAQKYCHYYDNATNCYECSYCFEEYNPDVEDSWDVCELWTYPACGKLEELLNDKNN